VVDFTLSEGPTKTESTAFITVGVANVPLGVQVPLTKSTTPAATNSP
jgi:hypothetical protein